MACSFQDLIKNLLLIYKNVFYQQYLGAFCLQVQFDEELHITPVKLQRECICDLGRSSLATG